MAGTQMALSETHFPRPRATQRTPTQKISRFPGATRGEPRFLLHTTMASCLWLRWCRGCALCAVGLVSGLLVVWLRVCPRRWRGSKRHSLLPLLLLLFHGEVFQVHTARCYIQLWCVYRPLDAATKSGEHLLHRESFTDFNLKVFDVVGFDFNLGPSPRLELCTNDEPLRCQIGDGLLQVLCVQGCAPIFQLHYDMFHSFGKR